MYHIFLMILQASTLMFGVTRALTVLFLAMKLLNPPLVIHVHIMNLKRRCVIDIHG